MTPSQSPVPPAPPPGKWSPAFIGERMEAIVFVFFVLVAVVAGSMALNEMMNAFRRPDYLLAAVEVLIAIVAVGVTVILAALDRILWAIGNRPQP